MFLDLLLMFVLPFRDLIKEFLLCEVPIFPVLLELLLDLLFFDVLGPVNLRLLDAVDILALVIDEPDKFVKCVALPTKPLLVHSLLLFMVLGCRISLYLIRLARKVNLGIDCRL